MLYVMCYVLYVVLKAAEVETAASHSTCASAATVRVPQPAYVCLSSHSVNDACCFKKCTTDHPLLCVVVLQLAVNNAKKM